MERSGMKSGILILEQVKTGKYDEIAFRLTDEARTKEKARRFFESKREREAKSGNTYKVEAEFEIRYQDRTTSQNNLLRGLERIMAMEQDQTEETYWEYHEGLIQRYAPDVDRPNPLTGRKQKKRTSELSTVEMAQVINGAFWELASMGLPLDTTNIQNYWIEWFRWRGEQAHDPFTEVWRSKEDYRAAVNVCEACLKGLRHTDEYGRERYQGQLAHIVSRGSGGADEQWNWMHLCTDCHLSIQHQHGWMVLIRKHPHIATRVARAQLKAGRKSSLEKDPEWKDILKKAEMLEKKGETVEPAEPPPEETELGIF